MSARMSDQIHRTTLNRICRYGKNGVDFDFDPHLVLRQFKDLYRRMDMKLVSFRVARLCATHVDFFCITPHTSKIKKRVSYI